MTQIVLPSRDTLKAQARRLRTTLAETGTPISHAAALEILARQWGYRDWNTLSAAIETAPAPRWQIGGRVEGRYLGHIFAGRIKSVNQKGADHAQLTLVFDEPVDVVASDKFSALRRQVTATVNAKGRTVEKTSDGQPHLVLH
ncbi:glyoxalase superfamily protein [Roseovarius sp. 2305UL8-3]|uniref:glyoxalase superfamily protein n=1 Tax=Roseovarius conchicola TaxID=3121636 RepID=UPI0035286802